MAGQYSSPNYNEIIVPLTLESLKPFPLPKELGNLPPNVLDQLSSLYELTKGFVLSLETYSSHEQAILRVIAKSVNALNLIVDLLAKYTAKADQITLLAKQLELLYKEFQRLETVQFQLLSSNYNTSTLKVKMERLAREADAETVALARPYLSQTYLAPDHDLLLFLQEFRKARKLCHMRLEKLSRWSEERIAGLM